MVPSGPYAIPGLAFAAASVSTVSPIRASQDLVTLHSIRGGRRPLAKTSSERGRYFRQRQKAHEEELERQVQQLRKQVAHLRSTRSVYAQKALLTRTSPCGSLVQLTRELYRVYRNGLETIDPMMMTMVATTEAERAQRQSLLSRVQYKEDFLHKVLDPDVVIGDLAGDLVGVDALLDQWRKHTLSYAKLEIELGHIETVTGSERSPIVILRSKMYARFSRETFQVMFPFVAGRRDDLAQKIVDQDLTFDCVSRFHFSEQGQITKYLIDINFVEALVKCVGDARDVAELMQLSVISPDAMLIDSWTIPSKQEEAACGGVDTTAEECTPSDPAASQRGKLRMQYLLSEEYGLSHPEIEDSADADLNMWRHHESFPPRGLPVRGHGQEQLLYL